jgi:hypothetical protein
MLFQRLHRCRIIEDGWASGAIVKAGSMSCAKGDERR